MLWYNMRKEKPKEIHDHYLKKLTHSLYEIDEDPRDIECIIKGLIWTPYRNMEEMCDLLLIHKPSVKYDDYYGITVELKANKKKKRKAVSQMESGKRFINKCLDLEVPYGKFVIYKRSNYIYELVEFD